MLKWAVNTPRLSYLTEIDTKSNTVDLQLNTLVTLSKENLIEPNQTPSTQTDIPSARRQRLKRKSSDFYLSRRLQNWLEKENQLEEQNQVTSTPLQSTSKPHGKSWALHQLNSLKDLSNIIPFETTSTHNSPKPTSSNLNTPNQSFGSCRIAHNNPSNYAATLPTLEVEYSPCSLVPGHILALRGLGIADTYFEKPRYLPPHDQNQSLAQPQPAFSTASSTFQSQRNMRRSLNSVRDDTTSLSSSKMGDQTLERMIDAILESTRKEKKPMKFARQFHHHQHVAMSPTYRPAEDPANDLSEFWSEDRNMPPAPIRKKRRSLPANMATIESFNEREVRSPIGAGHRTRRLQDSNNFNLHRQRAVRRKRKASKSSGKAKKNSTFKSIEATDEKDSPELAVLNSKTIDNASPDSGHNSASELDENSIQLEGDCLPVIDKLENTDSWTMDATKRRLSFSNKTISASQ